jgi:hypothetical protein
MLDAFTRASYPGENTNELARAARKFVVRFHIFFKKHDYFAPSFIQSVK